MITLTTPFAVARTTREMRCRNTPTQIIREKAKPDLGSMSVCDTCFVKFMERNASEEFTVTPIKKRMAKRAQDKTKKSQHKK